MQQINEKKSGSRPGVTVLMPVYNSGHYLRQAIESILGQTYSDFEFLIINDGSTDSSREIIASYSDPRIRLIDNETNIGLIRTLNRGLKLAKSELIARQDGDDISDQKRLELQVNYLSDNPEVVLLGSNSHEIDEHGNKRPSVRIDKPLEHVSVRWFQFFDNAFVHTSVMFRKKIILDKYGGYRWSDWNGDFDLWSRVALNHTVENLKKRLVYYRVNSSSLIGSLSKSDKNSRRSTDEAIKIIRRNLDGGFGAGAFTEEEARRLRVFMMEGSGKSADEFLELFDRLLLEYKKKYPECEQSEDFRSVIASQYGIVAYWILLSLHKLSAFKLFIRALRIYPGVLIKLPLGRIAILTLTGQWGRSVYNSLRSRITKGAA